MRISDWSSDVCSSDLTGSTIRRRRRSAPYGSSRAGKRSTISGPTFSASTTRSLGGRTRTDPHVPKGAPPVHRRLLYARSVVGAALYGLHGRSEEHTSDLQSLMRITYAVFCLKKKQIII